MLTSQQRFQSIYGLLQGVAIGDALASSMGGVSPQAACRKLGFKPLTYRGFLGAALTSDETHFALMAAQAILQSRSESSDFQANFRSRLKWYVLTMPPGLSWSTFRAGLRCWLHAFGVKSSVGGSGNSPSTRSLLLGVVLHNTGHRYQNWARECAQITHGDVLVGEAAAVLATAGQIAAVTSGARLNAEAALETLTKATRHEPLRDALTQLQPFIKANSSPRKVAKHFQWHGGMTKQMLPTTIMAIYCFLRFNTNFERAVRAALLLGGQNDSLVATVGGLMGAHLGQKGLPRRLADRVNTWPQDAQWIERIAVRLSDWPHGVDDLLLAPGEPTYPLGQLLRNLIRWPILAVRFVCNKALGC